MLSLRQRIMRWSYKLTWKKIIGFNTLVLILAGLIISREAVLNPTRTQSEAALLPKPQSITDQFETPTGPPTIYLVDHFFGKVGDAVLVHGENLGGLHENSFVSLAGKRIANNDLVGWAGNYIEFKVPVGAKSGKIVVNVLGDQTVWEGEFFVIDKTVEAELRLVGDPSTAGQEKTLAKLSGKGIQAGKNLLVWLLVISGEGELKLTPVSGVLMTQAVKDLPIGTVYEARLNITDPQLLKQSLTEFVALLSVEKGQEQVVGIARGELTDANGQMIPLAAHPLYVTF